MLAPRWPAPPPRLRLAQLCRRWLREAVHFLTAASFFIAGRRCMSTSQSRARSLGAGSCARPARTRRRGPRTIVARASRRHRYKERSTTKRKPCCALEPLVTVPVCIADACCVGLYQNLNLFFLFFVTSMPRGRASVSHTLAGPLRYPVPQSRVRGGFQPPPERPTRDPQNGRGQCVVGIRRELEDHSDHVSAGQRYVQREARPCHGGGRSNAPFGARGGATVW